MKNDDICQDIEIYSVLIQKRLEGTLSELERCQLAEWLWRDRKNRSYFKRLLTERNLKSYYLQRRQIDPIEEYKLLTVRCPEIGYRRLQRQMAWRCCAAIALLLLCVGTWQMYAPRKGTEVERIPGGDKTMAVLTTSQGKVFCLDGQGVRDSLICCGGVQFDNRSKELVCRQSDVIDPSAVHELDIPRGGEYKLVLPDGTKVWLNSESSIRFPGNFAAESREISLTGEVYLEVAREENRPFRIKAGGGTVEVLGTSFAMNVYPDDDQWSTTLIRGSIKASWGQQDLLLQPGRQAFLKAGKLEEQEVDCDRELAWLRGLFVFRHDRLEEVIRRISRWYDVDFIFEDVKLKDYVFTGQVSRDIGIENILDLMERMNVVSFEKKEDYILVKEKARDF